MGRHEEKGRESSRESYNNGARDHKVQEHTTNHNDMFHEKFILYIGHYRFLSKLFVILSRLALKYKH